MKKDNFASLLMAGGMVGGVLFAGTASAIDWNITGFVRQEIAYSLNSDGNPNNTMDDVFNDRITPNVTHANYGDAATTAAVRHWPTAGVMACVSAWVASTGASRASSPKTPETGHR